MLLEYECDDCEDTEWLEEGEFFEGMHCECGGHLFLKRYDNYEKIKEVTKCMTCKNNDSSKCKNCWFYSGSR